MGLFELFFDEGAISFIVKEPIATQKGVCLGLAAQELKCALGVLILSGYVSYPCRKMSWETSPDSHHRLVAGAIRRDRFDLILFSYLHFADNSELDGSDRFAKVHLLIERMNCSFQRHTPLEECYSFGQSRLRVLWAAGQPAATLDAAGLQGLVRDHQRRLPGVVRALAGHTVQLAGRCPGPGRQHGGLVCGRSAGPQLPAYHIFFDKVFASVRLLSILRKRGIKAVGTGRIGVPSKVPGS